MTISSDSKGRPRANANQTLSQTGSPGKNTFQTKPMKAIKKTSTSGLGTNQFFSSLSRTLREGAPSLSLGGEMLQSKTWAFYGCGPPLVFDYPCLVHSYSGRGMVRMGRQWWWWGATAVVEGALHSSVSFSYVPLRKLIAHCTLLRWMPTPQRAVASEQSSKVVPC